VNEAAAAFFHATFVAQEVHGSAIARDYVDERRMAPVSVERFQIGYAPNRWDALTHYLEGRGFTQGEIQTAGLAIEGERGAYDRFRHRLMFPIRDERGRVSGFGGRVLPGEALGAREGEHQPKYVNTSQSPIFDKGAILYALDIAKDAIRSEGRAVIVEGYMDVIAAHEHGFTNVVASMGTALTERQVGLLKRHTRNLILALDADAAGSEATLRGVQVVADAVDRDMEPQVNWRGVIRQQETLAADIRVVTMPEGRDPDDVIRNDASLWAELVDGAAPVLDYLFDAAAKRHDLSAPRARSAAMADLAPMIASISDRVVQSHYLQRLSRMVQVDEQTLRLELKRPVRKTSSNEAASAPTARAEAARDRKEEFCLALLIKYPELRAEGLGFDPDLFAYSENRALFETWVGWANSGEPFEESLSPDLRPQYERILSITLPAYDDDALVRALHDNVQRIEEQRLRFAKRASAAVIAEIAANDGATIAERALSVLQTGSAERDTADDEADPAQAFVEDMEVGRRVHERVLGQHRSTERPAR
jgi:DNA primase